MNNAKTLAGALIAGLMSGSLALADDGSTAPQSVPSPGSSATPKAVKRKPHNGIKNKMACCKNGCDCMDANGKKKEPQKTESK